MKKIFPLCLISLCVFISCKPKTPDYAEEIKGKWLCQEINNLVIPSDDAFVIAFQNNGNELYGQGYTLNDNEEKWWFENNFSYSVDKDVISVNGINPLGETVNLSLTIKNVTSNTLDYVENSTVINGADVSSGRRFFFTRLEDTPKNITKRWQGRHVIQADSTNNYSFRYTFLSDNSFEIEDMRDAQWIKLDIIGHYAIHGDFLILNTENAGKKSFECWHIQTLTNEKMLWNRWERISGSSNLQGIRYEFVESN